MTWLGGSSRIQEAGPKSQRTKSRGAVHRNTVALLPPGGCGMLGPQRGKKGWAGLWDPLLRGHLLRV